MLKDFLPPHIYRIEGQPNYFDAVRKKYVLVTPRETVRQRFVQYLIRELDMTQDFKPYQKILSYDVLATDLRAILLDTPRPPQSDFSTSPIYLREA